tara:strand:+ start:50 stop:454 length:405 start_codon:yes stop_codon:yes gene_type:complete
MAASNYSFTIEQGTTVDFEIQYKDLDGNPVDLTGYWSEMQIKSSYADNSPITYASLSSSLNLDGTGLNLSGSSGLNPPESGTIGIYISSNTSSLFTFTKAKYDLELYSGDLDSPRTLRLLEGVVNLSKEVTRPT